MVEDVEAPPPEESPFFGRLTVARFTRVVVERWLWLVVFLVVGLAIGWATEMALPHVYEAKRSFTMDFARLSDALGGGEGGVSYAELYNARLYDWVSESLLVKVMQQYRTNHAGEKVSDGELVEALTGAHIELGRNSRLVTVSVSAVSTNLCRELVTIYVDEIAAHSVAENARRGETSAAAFRKKADDQRALIGKLTSDLMQLRVATRVSVLKTDLERLTLGRDKVAEEVRSLEAEFTELIAWGKVLVAAGRDPEKFGTLTAKVPRSAEIQAEYRAMRDIEEECRAQLSVFTTKHPGVRQTGRSVLAARKRFDAAIQRARDTCKAKLLETRTTLALRRARLQELSDDRNALETRIAEAEARETRLAAELKLAQRLMEKFALEESRLSVTKEIQNENVVISGPATVSDEPVFPNTVVVVCTAAALSLFFGGLFILALDNREGHVSGLREIEEGIGLPVLTVIPHVTRDQRRNVARTLIESPHSHFAESVAALRNLLESPTYAMVGSHVLVVSTQPGEGKSITSTSLAIAFAQGGKKTLIVDFDLRRPQQAKIWELALTRETSFSHVLQRVLEKNEQIDFESLVHRVGDGFPDVIASLEPDGVYPGMIFGSRTLREFFAWARKSYERLVIDAPPWGLIGDVMSLATRIDATLIMCRPDRTNGAMIRVCHNQLANAGANVLGVVVNDADLSPGSKFAIAWRESGVVENACPVRYESEEVEQTLAYADDE